MNPTLKGHQALGGPSPRICLMGTPVSCENRGVLALAASLVDLVLEEVPEAQISFLVGNRDNVPLRVRAGASVREIPVVNYRLSARSRPQDHLLWIVLMSLIHRMVPISGLRAAIRRSTPWVRAVAEADLVGDIRGGDSFSDIYGVRRFLIEFFPVLAVILVRGDIVLLPQTYGPFSSRIARAVARWTIGHSSVILARDRQSVEMIGSLLGGRRREVARCPDVAFALQAERPSQIEADPPLRRAFTGAMVGINVNGLMYNGGYTRSNMFDLKMDYRTLLPELLIALLQRQAIELLLVPHTYGTPGTVETDLDSSLKVRNALPHELRDRVHVVTGNYDPHELKGIIGTCDFFIGSRMHACIAALSQSIPCVGIAYSRKFVGTFDSVGMGDWVVDGRTVDNSTAVKRVLSLYQDREKAREELQTRVEQARGELREAFARLLSATAKREGPCYE